MTTRVTGTYLRPDLTPERGYIDFLLVPAARQETGEQITSSVTRAELDATGSFSIDLVPDADLLLDGESLYAISEHIGGTVRKWWLSVPDDTAIDLPGRYPGATHAPRAYALPIPGPVGPIGPTGPASTVPGPIGPTGPQGERGIQGEQGIPGEIQNSQIWAPGTESLSPLVTAYDPVVGQLQIAGVEVGDTQNRSINAGDLLNGWQALAGYARLRRVGYAVWLSIYCNGAAATSPDIYQLPAGFRPGINTTLSGMVKQANGLPVADYQVSPSGAVKITAHEGGTTSNINPGRFLTTFPTDDPWPTTLPGTPPTTQLPA